MKRGVLAILFATALAAAPARAADVFLLGFTGFDYQDPNSDPGTYLALGEGYQSVGFVTSFGPLLAPYVDQSTREYTYHLDGLTVTSRGFLGSYLTVGFGNGGRGRYFSDPLLGGTPGTYGTNPPNATAPSSFTDGTLELGGRVDNFVLTYNFNNDTGDFSSDMTLDEGAQLIYIPSGQRAGWSYAGIAGRPNATVPDGYDHQVSGECRIPDATPTTHTTWGAVKALYH